MAKTEDERLIKQILDGQRNAMEELYRRLSPCLFAVCRRYLSDYEDAKDVLQETFIKIFSSLATFRTNNDGTLRAWAAKIAVNNSLNFLRSRRPFSVSMEENLPDIPDEEIHAERLPAEAIQRLIEGLPEGYRTVFNLYAIEQLSHKQIARLLGISEATSASQYHRAKKLLKTRITKLLKDE